MARFTAFALAHAATDRQLHGHAGSEIAGEAAAALAATAAVFRASGGAQYAGEVASLISTAEELYQLALSMDASYKGTTNPVLAIHDRLYPSTG